MACKKHPKTQVEVVNSSGNNFNEGAPVGVAVGSAEDGDNNHVEFPANGSIIASKTACVANLVSENLLKLCTDALKSVMEWCTIEQILNFL